ncbi:hypothetical protein [Sphingopyxis sp. PET50]|uniref:hypothetical protein n=1 Tax=Sphingopyxis sp. PET50 TaxID=2976533 RepID=UPI0021B07B62|nr:hypothetical protein [Sphingopyxis sp. PET50]
MLEIGGAQKVFAKGVVRQIGDAVEFGIGIDPPRLHREIGDRVAVGEAFAIARPQPVGRRQRVAHFDTARGIGASAAKDQIGEIAVGLLAEQPHESRPRRLFERPRLNCQQQGFLRVVQYPLHAFPFGNIAFP